MRRRISLTMFAMVVGALLFAGLATLGLTYLNSVRQTQTELVSTAKKLALGVQTEVATGRRHESISVLRQSLSVLKAPLQLQGEAVFAVSSNFSFYNLLSPGQGLPSGLSVSQLDTGDLINGLPVTGHRGRLAYAAYLFSTPVTVANVDNLVVVLTREAPNGVGDAGAWFAIAAAATLAVALIAADRLGNRLARPLRQTETVTRRIAAGDLEARVPVPAGVGHELVSLATSVNQMAASLARAQGTQRQFLMSVSHDLRTPLTSIRGFAEALYDGATTDVHYAAGVIGAEAGRLERLVTDLLELAKLEAGAFSLHCRALDLSEVVSDAAQAFAPAASSMGLAVQIRTAPPQEVRCEADPDRLGQVVGNLVENALKFATSVVTVSTGMSEGRPWVAVEDDGPGIPEDDLGRVFERLFQSRSAEGRKLGSGLGLAIVDELVVAMGGRVTAASPTGPHGGTRVVATLKPALSAADQPDGPVAAPASSGPRPA
jgi:two-component system sensor histidine kinase BaeS